MVMERDTLQIVTMVTTLTVMVAAETVMSKLVSHVTVDPQAPRMLVPLFSHHPFQLKTEVNQDFTEKLS